ncbi:hypothetical protein CLOM_g2428 [Closterium sp. NIES-68]|nr:hypothetical protein CLOM_g2428 [Closterium sp. NIES-68]
MASHHSNGAPAASLYSYNAICDGNFPLAENPAAIATTTRAGEFRIPLYAATTHGNGLLGLKLATDLPLARKAHGFSRLREHGEKLAQQQQQQQRPSLCGKSIVDRISLPASPTRVVATSRVKFADEASQLSSSGMSQHRATPRQLVLAGTASHSLSASLQIDETAAEIDLLPRKLPATTAYQLASGSGTGGEGARQNLHPVQQLAAQVTAQVAELKHAASGAGSHVRAAAENAAAAVASIGASVKAQAQARGKIKLRLSPAASRLLSGAIAGGVSRTAVAPLETVRTHMMCADVGSVAANGSMTRVFQWVVEKEGWAGLFRGNAINVLRVAPSKAIEMFTYETVKRALTPTPGLPPPLPFLLPLPISSIAGSSAGIASTVLMYPLELVKTRLTVNPHLYRGFFHAFHRIAREEGVGALYRGLAPSVMGVIPYSGRISLRMMRCARRTGRRRR